MKKLLALLMVLELLLLTGCSSRDLELLLVEAAYKVDAIIDLDEPLFSVPRRVRIEGEVYRTGFYGDLWAKNLTFTGEEYEVRGTTFRRLDCGTFDCIQAGVGSKTGGMLYCLDSQWEEAKAYYEDPENYTYYCGINVKESREEDRQYFEVEDMDIEKYEALMGHGGAFAYDPFDPVKNRASEFKEVIIDAGPWPYINFFKISKDGILESFKAYYFFILDGTMYQARYHNLSEDSVSAVEVPEETAAYFIELVERLQTE
ncbi:MAG: hypothetical protein HFF18_00175 [Oscillospiraceae bacterium]|nr:hypothetical protein [Oscillospiraceae bacterium]